MNKSAVKIKSLSFGYGKEAVLKKIDISLDAGEIVGIIGPNGSGKSTLVRLVSGLLKPWSGEITVNDRPVLSYARNELARLVATVSQEPEREFPFTVREIVAMGRTPYTGRFAIEGKRDKEVIDAVMEAADIGSLAERFPHQLSGGERQRMMIARALAQEAEILLMDEPTTHLDINHQLEVNRLVLKMQSERNLSVLYVTHDLNIAAECCSRLVLLKEGELFAEGDPADVLTSDNIRAVYGCQSLVDQNPVTSRPRVTPLMEAASG